MNFLPFTASALAFLPDSLSGVFGLLGALGLYVLISWFVCVSAAFFKVERVHVSVGLLAIAASIISGTFLAVVCKSFLPEVASTFTPQGLFLITAAAGALVCSVPLVQYSWHISYSRSVMVMCGAVVIFISSLALFQTLLRAPEPLRDRLSVQILAAPR